MANPRESTASDNKMTAPVAFNTFVSWTELPVWGNAVANVELTSPELAEIKSEPF